MSEQAIEDLQTRISYQEASIDELTKHSLAQQKQIDLMALQIAQLQAQLQQVAEVISEGGATDVPPPHY